MRAPKRRTIDARWRAEQMYPNRGEQPAATIQREVERLFPLQPYATHGSVCADLLFHKLLNNQTARENPRAWRDTLIRQVILADRRNPQRLVGNVLVYSYNDKQTGRRLPKSPVDQDAAFKRNLFAVWPAVVQSLSNPEPVAVANEAVKEPERVEVTPERETEPLRAHLLWSQSVRRFCEQRDADGSPLWDWSMRNTHDGMALIAAGIDPYAPRDASTMHFPDDVRRELGVKREYDFTGFGVAKYLSLASKARVPLPGNKSRSVCLMMVGPMGSGKSTAAGELARELGVDYGKVSMTMGTSPSAFNGRPRVAEDGSLLAVLTAIARGEHDQAATLADQAIERGDVTVSQFARIYRNGGVFLFDEIDAADSNLLLIVNDALSSATFANAATGQDIGRSENFVGLAAANTLGLGADRIYGGRERLDGASLDRWASGRIRVGYDLTLETEIAESMIEAAQ